MFTTGEFTKIARVTRRTLRHYREIGLFEPVKSVEESGYHYYTMEQLPQLHRILALKDLGFSLEQIRSMVGGAIDTRELRGMLRLRKAEIEREMAEESLRIRSIEARLSLLESELGNDEVLVKSLPAKHYLSTRFVCEGQHHALAILSQVADELPAYIEPEQRGYLLSRLHSDAFDPSGAEIEVGYLLDGLPSHRGVSLDGLEFTQSELPLVQTAVTLVVEGHPDLWCVGTNAIGDWIARNNFRIAAAQREVWYSYGASPDEQPVVELQWPVEIGLGDEEMRDGMGVSAVEHE